MEAIAGVFRSREDATRAAIELRHTRFDGEHVNLLYPESSEDQIHGVSTSYAEQPGIGAAIGAVVGGALGVAGGLELGAGTVALLLGVGPVMAIGAAAAALLGLGAAVGGAAVGSAIDESATEGVPADEVFFYEDALRQGRSVVIAMAEDHADAEWARHFMAQAGAETVDAAREAWWIGVRDAEKQHYQALGENFDQEEDKYRAGFEAALRRDLRRKSYVAGMDTLRAVYPKVWESPAFRSGFDRGQVYLQSCQQDLAPR